LFEKILGREHGAITSFPIQAELPHVIRRHFPLSIQAILKLYIKMYLYDFDFDSSLPQMSQAESLSWLAEQHSRRSKKPLATVLKRINRFGCKVEAISARRTWLPEFSNGVPLLQDVAEDPAMDVRMQCFESRVLPSILKLYKDKPNDFDHLLHVTCTGYQSPSVAERLLLHMRSEAIVQHVYHMGCYASIPAVRTAQGLVATEKANVEILHTEFCTLHLNLYSDSPEQLVIQSLFADASIRYRASGDIPKVRSLRVLATHEQLIPDSLINMEWNLAPLAFAMTLSKEVPTKISAHLPQFLKNLLAKAGLDSKNLQAYTFAIHPGGPRIIESLQGLLKLRDEQVIHSRKVLQMNGNMSSATLPFIWKGILEDSESNQLVISLAFGPGLTIAGCVLCPI
jgi:predicted naringenin-chalcone synthase